MLFEGNRKAGNSEDFPADLAVPIAFGTQICIPSALVREVCGKNSQML